MTDFGSDAEQVEVSSCRENSAALTDDALQEVIGKGDKDFEVVAFVAFIASQVSDPARMKKPWLYRLRMPSG